MGGWSWLDSIYMAVTTLSMVGYRDDVGGPMTWQLQVFTVGLILFGMSAALYVLAGLFQMMTEGEINRALGLRRVTREIERLNGHVIVCGFGRTGEILAGELARENRPFVVIDNDPERITEAIALGYLALTDNRLLPGEKPIFTPRPGRGRLRRLFPTMSTPTLPMRKEDGWLPTPKPIARDSRWR